MRTTWLIVALLGLVSCGPSRTEIDVDAVIDEIVQERLLSFQERVQEQCYQRVLVEASRRADSILLLLARLERDSAYRPARAYRPGDPIIKQLKEPLPLQPLFSDSLLLDSLLRYYNTDPTPPQ